MSTTGPALEYQRTRWLTERQTQALYTADYWNDLEAERSKPWWDAVDGSFEALETHLRESWLLRDLEACIDTATKAGRAPQGVGADLAAGALWSVPALLAVRNVEKIYCVEMSQHRLMDLGPKVLAHYNVSPEAVELCLGSFYDVRLPNGSLDFVVLVSAFHHAAEPDRLLAEVRRILKPGGVLLIAGEHKITKTKRFASELAKYVVSRALPTSVQRRLFGKAYGRQELSEHLKQVRPAPNPLLGDHYYFLADYRLMFSRNGFELTERRSPGPFRCFVAWPDHETAR